METNRVRAPIVVEGLSVSYGGRAAVDGVDLHVDAGEVVGFLGPNGAGKTTTIRCLLGLLRADRGAVRIDGRCGYLPEGHVGYEAQSARSYLATMAAYKGVARDDVGRVLDLVDAADLASRPVGRLSKGQRQRIGLAQALLGEPEVLVLDEPTSGLDPAQVAAVRAVLRRAADAGTAVLVSTHLLAEAAATCDRVVVIARGRVVATERPGAAGDLEARFLRLVAEAELGGTDSGATDG